MCQTALFSGAPGGNRTPNHRLKRPLLCLVELRVLSVQQYRKNTHVLQNNLPDEFALEGVGELVRKVIQIPKIRSNPTP